MGKDALKKSDLLGRLEDLIVQIRMKARPNAEPTANITTFEEGVLDLVHQVGALLLAQELSRHEPISKRVLIDGVVYTNVTRDVGTYMTILGPVSVLRGRYRAVRNGPTLSPLERKLGIVEGFWTPKAAKVAALALTDLTPRRAETLFSEMGALPASKSSFDRLPKGLGRRWEAQREDYEAILLASDDIPEDAVTVAISCDGVMVTMTNNQRNQRKSVRRARGRRDSGPTGQREATAGALSFYDAEGKRLTTRRVARMPQRGQGTLREILRAELASIRQQRPDLRVVAVADGARGIWSFLGDIGADVEVVDFYHATNHLKDALDQLMGATSKETHQRFEELRHILLKEADGVDQVIVALDEHQAARKKRAIVTRSARYFRRHRDRMQYAKLKANHLPIGSGVIEGTCKSIVSDRLKRGGMRWSEPGGQAILTLRALSQSDRFDRGWALLKTTYDSNIACHYAEAA